MGDKEEIQLDLSVPDEGKPSSLSSLEPVGWLSKKFLLPKFLHFSVFFMWGSYWPFFTLYLNKAGNLDPGVIGSIGSIFPFVALAATPAWSNLADRISSHRLIFTVTLVLSYISILSQYFILHYQAPFAILLIVSILIGIATAPIVALADYFVLEILRHDEHQYGKQRLWGAIAWGLSAFISGNASDRFGISAIFLPFSLGFFMTLCLVPLLPSNENETHENSNQPKKNFFALVDTQLVLFNFHGFILGIGMAFIMRFLPLYLVNYLGASDLLIGLTIVFTVVMELPFFFWSDKLLKLLGIKGMMILAHLCYMIRALLYTFLSNPWWVLPIEFLHGITFSCFWTASIQYITLISTKGLKATIVGVFSAVNQGGSGTGVAVGGWIFHKFGPVFLYRAAGVMMTLSLILFIFSHKTKVRETADFQEIAQDSESGGENENVNVVELEEVENLNQNLQEK